MSDESLYLLKWPLVSWPGEIHLPPPDDFNGLHWQTWMAESTRPLRSEYAMIHRFAYAGLAFLAKHGGWQMDIPLAEVQAWETKPEDERTKLIAWLGKSWIGYVDAVVNPKE